MPAPTTLRRHAIRLIAPFAVAIQIVLPAHAAGWPGSPGAALGGPIEVQADDRPAIYSYPVNTYPDGWAALKAEPWGGSQRLTKVYDGTLFLVIGQVPGWKLVRFKSGERGWIAERLVGCCRPASH